MQTLQAELRLRINQISLQYHRLLFLVNQNGQVKSDTLGEIIDELAIGYVNLGKELSLLLLNFTERQRIICLLQLIEQIINNYPTENPVFLEHIEILFEPYLHQDPLRLLEGLSRNRTLIGLWNGQYANGLLTYATPEHPEYHRYSIADIHVLNLVDYSM